MKTFAFYYTLAGFALSYIFGKFALHILKFNYVKEARKNPKSFGVGALIIASICELSALLTQFLMRITHPAIAYIAGVLLLLISGVLTFVIVCDRNTKLHGFFFIPLAIIYYLIPLFVLQNSAEFLIFAVLDALTFALFPLIYNELSSRASGRLSVTSRTNKNSSLRAVVLCGGTEGLSAHKYIYKGLKDCGAQSALCSGSKYCKYGCLGCGSCENACKFSAIVMLDGLAAIKSSKCVGCGACVSVCPRHLIKLIPIKAKYWVGCSSLDGKQVGNLCRVNCDGCGKCTVACPQKAISVNGSLASIDYSKCIGCGKCAEVCPKHSIWKFPDLN